MQKEKLGHLKEWFAGYCRSFYSTDAVEQRNIILKEQHTYNVCANMAEITAAEQLPEDRQRTAETIALFHDLGRFEQYRRYKTFKDSDSINHAVLGAKLLKESGLIDDLPEGAQNIIMQSVRLHNVFAVPEKLDADIRYFVELIRDADKLDIWRVFIEFYALPLEERASAVSLGFPDEPGYSLDVLATLAKGEMINLSQLKTLNDFKLLQLSWVYDLNFSASFSMVAERNYIGRLAMTLPSDEQILEGVRSVRKFVEKKVKF